MGEDVARPRGGELLDGGDVVGPGPSTSLVRPLVHGHGVIEIVEAPGPDPVDRSEEDVKGVSGQEVGHVTHPPTVVVDLEPEHHGKPGRLGRLHTGHVTVEVGPGMVIPVAPMDCRSPASGSSSQNPRSRWSA